jgi:hypothetical protein
MIVAYSRYTIWNWHRDDATADMRRGGIELDPIPYLGSNEMLIAPSRTKDKAVIAVIDPHLSWYWRDALLRNACLRARIWRSLVRVERGSGCRSRLWVTVTTFRSR